MTDLQANQIVPVKEIIPRGYHQNTVILENNTRILRCGTLANIWAYRDELSSKFMVTDPTYEVNEGAVKPRHIREKCKVSTGYKDDAEFLKMRPDISKSSNTTECIVGISKIEINGVSTNIDLSKKETISPIITNLGSVRLLTGKNSTRILIPTTNKTESFKVEEPITLKGTKIFEKDGGFWVYDLKDNFLCKFRKPFLTENGFDPIPNTEGWLQHELKAGTYIKRPTEKYDPSKLPAKFFISGGDIYYSSTEDGYMYNSDSNWSNARDTGPADVIDKTSHFTGIWGIIYFGGSYSVGRSFFYFDTSNVGTVDTCTAYFKGEASGNTGEDGIIQKGTQADTLVVGDFLNFSGNSYGTISSWVNANWNSVSLDATGCSEIVDGTSKMCVREKDYDYDNSAPGAKLGAPNTWFTEEEGTTSDPYLDITEAASFVPRNISIV